MTRREQLIMQLRAALAELESPVSDEVVFEIGETAFDFEKELLDAPLPHYLVEQAL